MRLTRVHTIEGIGSGSACRGTSCWQHTGISGRFPWQPLRWTALPHRDCPGEYITWCLHSGSPRHTRYHLY